MVVAKRQGNQPRNHSYKWIKHSCHKSSVETQKEYDLLCMTKANIARKNRSSVVAALIYRFSFFRCLPFVFCVAYIAILRPEEDSQVLLQQQQTKRTLLEKKERVLSFSSFSLVPRRFLCVSLAALKKRRNEVDFQSFLMFSGGSRYYMSQQKGNKKRMATLLLKCRNGIQHRLFFRHIFQQQRLYTYQKMETKETHDEDRNALRLLQFA